jgi:hypothetical protein
MAYRTVHIPIPVPNSTEFSIKISNFFGSMRFCKVFVNLELVNKKTDTVEDPATFTTSIYQINNCDKNLPHRYR